MFKRRGY